MKNSCSLRDERRKSKRFQMPLEVEYRTLTKDPLSGKVNSRDISRDGIAMCVLSEINRGVSLRLKMNVPGNHLPVFATGKVAWADGMNTGVRLTKITKFDQERILECIYQGWLTDQRLTGRGGRS